MNIAGLVTYVSSILNDQEAGNSFLVWDEPLVRSAIMEAIGAVARVTPSDFIATGTMTLTPGTLQVVPVERRRQFTVMSQTCGDSVFTSTHTDFKQALPQAIRASDACGVCPPRQLFPCAAVADPCKGWNLKRWAWSPTQPSELRVDPPVPNDNTPRVLTVSWLGELAPAGEAPLHDMWKPAVVEYALHRLYSVDHESQVHQAASAQHFVNYTNLVAVPKQSGATAT